jgi:hypothetical protein
MAPASRAEIISFQVLDPNLSALPGGTATFTGTVTNDSGVDLSASSFFFVFFGFDPAALSLTQNLGVSTDFPIPTGTTSAPTALFSATLGDVTEGSVFSAEAELEDIHFDESISQTVTVSAGNSVSPPPSTVPEPATLLTVLLTLAVVALSVRWRCRLG